MFMYAEMRDRIEAAAALARGAEQTVAVLDHEGCDAMTVGAKTEVVSRVWASFKAAVDRLDG